MCFSALQRAENSSIYRSRNDPSRGVEFQCSSASRKFLNRGQRAVIYPNAVRFSALQRAENSSIVSNAAQRGQRYSFSALQRAENSSNQHQRRGAVDPRCVSVLFSEPKIPQFVPDEPVHPEARGFSALQRAENSSIEMVRGCNRRRPRFQCSSASRKFLNLVVSSAPRSVTLVSVLFSEPKIPQSSAITISRSRAVGFSALQRAENSSIGRDFDQQHSLDWFQCSSASRKFLNRVLHSRFCCRMIVVSVLFSEPKIPQLCRARRRCVRLSAFQCSSASRKFLNFGDSLVSSAGDVGFSALQRAENSSI